MQLMRIGYYVPPTLLAHSGIGRRVEATAGAWSRLGHEAVLVSRPTTGANPLVTHLRGDAEAAKGVAEGAFGRLDHLHVRLFLPTPGWMRLPGDLPVSVEVQAGLRRAENARDIVRVVVGASTARWMVRKAAMGAFVTSEFAAYPEFARIPTKVITGNGVELTEPYQAPDTDVPTVGMAVGTPADWHGMDRFAALARCNPGFDFVVIAPLTLQDYIRSATSKTRLRSIFTRGQEDYEAALASLSIAVGSLALDRKGLTEAAPLKVRDYVRAGIPTALAYRDTNLTGTVDPALLEWNGAPSTGFSEWIAGNVGRRLAPGTREAVSIDRIEARRVAAMVARAD